MLGFGRSGTSALTRVLSLCGATLPPGLLGATGENPRGFWEPRAVIHLNEAILRQQGSSGYDMTLPDDSDSGRSSTRRAAWIDKISAYLSSLPPAPVVVIKEPKTTALCAMWFEAARQSGFDVAAAIAVRHPAEVIASIDKRTRQQNYVQSSPELVSAWWLKFTLLAERDTRSVPRVIVDYANLMSDWRREVDRIGAALDIDLSVRDEAAVEEFLTTDLHHHRSGGPVPEPFGTDWMGTVYGALHAAACDQRFDEADLDRVYEEYQRAERGFGRAHEDHRRYRRFNRLLLPPLVKLSLEGLALAHRRRGTWS